MAVIQTYEGKEKALELMIAQFAFMNLRLFKNDFTPDNDTVLGDFTEADFSGYSQVNITTGAVVENGDGNAQSTALIVQFIHNGGATANDVYGWYLVTNDNSDEVSWYAERFSDAPRTMAAENDEIDITPQLVYGDCVP